MNLSKVFRNRGDLESRFSIDPKFEASREIFRDGSALYRASDGHNEIIDPPRPGDKYEIEFEDCNLESNLLCTAISLNEAKEYIRQMVDTINGPGCYTYRIFKKNKNIVATPRKKIFKYIGFEDFDDMEHSQDFREDFCAEDYDSN